MAEINPPCEQPSLRMTEKESIGPNEVQRPSTSKPAIAAAYYYQDFEWEHLREEVERELQLQSLETPSTSGNFIATQSCTIEAWKKFHERHGKRSFFKERRYLIKEFPELLDSEKALKVLEIGCGTGSSVLPILRANSKATVYACDCSESALKRAQDIVLNADPQLEKCRFVPFYCDISTQTLPDWLCCQLCLKLKARLCKARTDQGVPIKEVFCSISLPQNSTQWWEPAFENNSSLTEHGIADEGCFMRLSDLPDVKSEELPCCVGGMDITMMVFTLSSIPPQNMQHVIKECFSILKPGGLILFRDYGLYDMTMRRFPVTQQVGDRLYQRSDGTLSYFFTPDVLRDLFTKAGFLEEEISLCCVELKNRQKQLPMKRVWIHAKFSRPV